MLLYSLNKNYLRSLSTLRKSLRHLPRLEHLCLIGNPLCPHPGFGIFTDDGKGARIYQRFRISLIKENPNLQFLDDKPVTDEELRMCSRMRGNGLFVANQAITKIEFGRNVSSPVFKYSNRDADPNGRFYHRPEGSAFGKLKYNYMGKHSEGNRFIKNKDL